MVVSPVETTQQVQATVALPQRAHVKISGKIPKSKSQVTRPKPILITEVRATMPSRDTCDVRVVSPSAGQPMIKVRNCDPAKTILAEEAMRRVTNEKLGAVFIKEVTCSGYSDLCDRSH